MIMKLIKFIFQAFFILITVCVVPNSYAELPNDQENYLGDAIRCLLDVKASTVTTIQTKTTEEKTICIPGLTRMEVIGQDNEGLIVILKSKAIDCLSKKELKSGGVGYRIKKDDLKNKGFMRVGITYGTLVLPFKYQLTGNQDFTGSSTVGGYVGYRWEWMHNLGTTLTPIVFAGASLIPVNETNENNSSTLGFSCGGGIIATLKGAFQMGVVFGIDRVGSNANYQYNDNGWVSLEIGYTFLQ
jgi:hypothetical protein